MSLPNDVKNLITPSRFGLNIVTIIVDTNFVHVLKKEEIMNTLVKKPNGRNLADPWPTSEFFDIDNLFGRSWLKPFEKTLPAVNISEDEKSYTVDVVAPGMKKDNFKVNVEDDVLTISAEAKHENTEKDESRQYSRREYSHSSFTRSFRLPDNAKVDNISASYEDGVLKLTIPKTKMQVKSTKEIKVN